MKRKKSAIHNLSHSVKYSSKMGPLMPIACFDVVPGDKIDHHISALIRTQPLLAPVMHAVDIDLHVYFSPDRLVWDKSEDFHTGGEDGMDATEAPWMYVPVPGYAKGTLADYLGLPVGDTTNTLKHSALPFRHYALIYNHWYRDSQLQSEVPFSKASGQDTTTPRDLLFPCWKRDYFTKCRPAPQLGPDVFIPLVGDAPVVSDGTVPNVTGAGATNSNLIGSNAGGTSRLNAASGFTSIADVQWGNNTGLEADLSQVAGVDIRDLRESSAVQRFEEFNNIFGGRYAEQLQARFGVRVQDSRLQWPEHLGSGSAKIQFSEVLQTGGTDAGASTGVGNMKGHGISLVGSNRYRRRIPEHGYVFVFMLVRPKTQYMQGLHRSWSRESKFDYLLPEFQHIGDQAVLNKEIYAAHGQPANVFGYTPQYEEYRTIPSRVAGDFRDTLKYWHMARDFGSAPSLNSTFVTCNPTNRIYPDTSGDQLYVEVFHTIMARRQLTKQPQYRLM